MSELFGWSEQAWHVVDQVGILLGVVMGSSWLLGLSLALFKPHLFRRWFTRNRFPNVGGHSGLEKPHAIIFTVSREEVPLWVLDQLKPRWAGFLATSFSEEAARKLVTEARKRGALALEPVLMENADDPAEARDKIRYLLGQLREKGTCAVDVTGGKTPMSLGAFMAAEELGAKTIYVSTEYNQGKPDMRTAAILCISKPVN